MAHVYACPVHVDRQGNEPNRVCPICGLPSVILRAESTGPTEGARLAEPVPDAKPEPKVEREAPGDVPPADTAAKLDQIIVLLSQIRDRLGPVA
jgi:hypothetical protein